MRVQTFLLSVLFMVISVHCGNYDLLVKFENPGQSGTAQSCGSNCRIYVTTGTFTGNLGGIAGADNICIGNMNNPAGSGQGNWKALLAGGGRVACNTTNCTTNGIAENINWALKPMTNYRRASDNLSIGMTNGSAIFVFPLSNSLAAGTQTIWTGLTTDWMVNGNICAGWADNITGQGMTGQTGDNTFSNIAFGGQSCTDPFPLLCVEQ